MRNRGKEAEAIRLLQAALNQQRHQQQLQAALNQQRHQFQGAYHQQLMAIPLQSSATGIALQQEYARGKRRQLDREIVAQPIEGWRAWHTVEETNALTKQALRRMAAAWNAGRNPFRELLGPFLSAVSDPSRILWPDEPAICSAGHPHPVPDAGCQCGYWALRDEGQLDSVLASYQAHVYGRVQLWGRVIEHEQGYRGQYLRPVELFVGLRCVDSAELAEALAVKYGVPTSVVEWDRETTYRRFTRQGLPIQYVPNNRIPPPSDDYSDLPF